MKERRTTDIPDFQVLKTVFYYCFSIIICPIVAFFGSKIFIFDGIFQLSNVYSHVYSAVFAVVVLHIAVGLFIYRAYSGPSLPITKLDKKE